MRVFGSIVRIFGRWCWISSDGKCRYQPERQRDKTEFLLVHVGSPLLNASRIEIGIIKNLSTQTQSALHPRWFTDIFSLSIIEPSVNFWSPYSK
jgi:hypothetical protein